LFSVLFISGEAAVATGKLYPRAFCSEAGARIALGPTWQAADAGATFDAI
jgi:hypothetical protein